MVHLYDYKVHVIIQKKSITNLNREKFSMNSIDLFLFRESALIVTGCGVDQCWRMKSQLRDLRKPEDDSRDRIIRTLIS